MFPHGKLVDSLYSVRCYDAMAACVSMGVSPASPKTRGDAVFTRQASLVQPRGDPGPLKCRRANKVLSCLNIAPALVQAFAYQRSHYWPWWPLVAFSPFKG